MSNLSPEQMTAPPKPLSEEPVFFVRWGSAGQAYGWFASRDAALHWLNVVKGERPEHEGATFKIYEALTP